MLVRMVVCVKGGGRGGRQHRESERGEGRGAGDRGTAAEGAIAVIQCPGSPLAYTRKPHISLSLSHSFSRSLALSLSRSRSL